MQKRIITINRMYGSNGRNIGKALAERLGIKYYDRELLELVNQKENIPFDELVKADEKRASRWVYPVDDTYQMDPRFHFYPMNDVVFDSQSKIIRELAEKEDCIIIGRCANYLLGDKCKSIFIHAPFETRVRTIMERAGREEKSARSAVKRLDKERRSYYEYFTDEKWLDMGQYDLCIDSSKFTKKQILDMLTALYEQM